MAQRKEEFPQAYLQEVPRTETTQPVEETKAPQIEPIIPLPELPETDGQDLPRSTRTNIKQRLAQVRSAESSPRVTTSELLLNDFVRIYTQIKLQGRTQENVDQLNKWQKIVDSKPKAKKNLTERYVGTDVNNSSILINRIEEARRLVIGIPINYFPKQIRDLSKS